MTSINIKNRIKKASVASKVGRSLEIVADAINRDAFYDELTEEEKEAYCEYRNCEREVLEKVENAINGNLHFRIEKKMKPPTEKELRERITEVEQILATDITAEIIKKGDSE